MSDRLETIFDPFEGAADRSSMVLRWSGEGVVVELGGDVDVACQQRARVIGDLLARWPQEPVVDASQVAFIDVVGLRCVMSLAGEGEPVLVLDPSRVFLHLLDLLARAGSGPSVAAAPTARRGLVLRERERVGDAVGHGRAR